MTLVHSDLPDDDRARAGQGISQKDFCAAIVVRGCGYLVDTYDPERLGWPIIPRDIDKAPHAPWWSGIRQSGKTTGCRRSR